MASSYDPYALTWVNQPVKTIFPKTSNASEYVKKQYFQNLFSIESNRTSITDPFRLATSYFPPKFHWIPEHSEKDVQYYSNILRHENSITIKAIPNKNNSTKIIYHSAFLNHIIFEEMWGPNPASTRRLPTSPFPYSYHDYLTAWFKFMLHQNENMSHSWFVNFDKDFNSDLPLWFIHWWTQFSLVTEIFPESLVGSFQYFTRVCSNLMLMGSNFLLCSISLKNIRFLRSWNGNMIGKVMFSLAAGMLSGGISFLTPKQLLTMSPKNSHPQILYWRLRSIPQCKKLK